VHEKAIDKPNNNITKYRQSAQ